MNTKLTNLVEHIRRDGCSVFILDGNIVKISQSAGYFDIEDGKPLIRIARDVKTRLEFTQLLLHEYSHYLQWKDGYLGRVENICNGWDILDRWLAGEEFSHADLYRARNSILLIEYDAEIRTVKLSRQFKIDIGASYLNNAHSYIGSIKNAFRKREWGTYTLLNMNWHKLRVREILAPLTQREIAKIEKGPA